MVNAWGDGFRANELYNIERESVIDNGFIPVKEDSYIKEDRFGGEVFQTKIFTSPERTDSIIRQYLPKNSLPLPNIDESDLDGADNPKPCA